ncbi:Glycosyl transferase, group 1 family protein [plant metagenome]|uniref:Glycosyl transferase, group 1 family protein n=1 Tax=plant metagenome TaxID=1297885 RepID=A0A484RNH3_9ZZZZ
MKILLLVSSMHAGGAERVAATLVNAWAERGDAPTLLPTYSSKGSCFYPVSDGVDFVWLADLAGVRGGGPLAAITRLRALRKHIRALRPDVVVSFLTNVNVAAVLATRGLKVPVIVCERTNPVVGKSAGPLLSLARRLTYPFADMVTVQAQATVEPFQRMVPGLRRLEVVPNPLPPELASAPVAARLPAVDARRRIMAMGRLVPEKQFDLLIDVFGLLADANPRWDLCIWGEGPEREALQARIDGLGLADRITLAGRTETPWEVLSQGDAFALTSAVEGFPNVLLEAMALGLPCVAFDCPSGPREMTREGQDALLVAAGDRQGLAQALTRLMQDEALRLALAERAARAARGRYALPAVLSIWDELFAKVGARNARAAVKEGVPQ